MNQKLKEVFKDTCKIFKEDMELSKQLEESMNNTLIINIDDIKSYKSEIITPINIVISNESSIDEALKQSSSGKSVMVLNFASAISPGGGVKNGSTAQEESLCRASGLYQCLVNQKSFYNYHRLHKNYLYNNVIIYSPNVPVIKDNEGNLLDKPNLISFITSPAVYAKYARMFFISDEKINSVMKERINKLIDFIIEKSPDCAILGAFGCGVFKNNPNSIATMFKEAIVSRSNELNSRNIKIVFAIYDKEKTGVNYRTFHKILKEDTK